MGSILLFRAKRGGAQRQAHWEVLDALPPAHARAHAHTSAQTQTDRQTDRQTHTHTHPSAFTLAQPCSRASQREGNDPSVSGGEHGCPQSTVALNGTTPI